jgi:predicted aspartyl protease
MHLPLEIPIIVKDVNIIGPDSSIEIDLILDTGSVFTVISWHILKMIRFDPATISERIEVVTANGTVEAPMLMVDKIVIDDIEAQNIEVICHDIPDLTGVRGVLGLNFLQYFRTVIDYKQGYLEIS